MKSVIADSAICSTNLMNSLQTINRETERISDNAKAAEQFETCKQLRRRVLRYVCLGLGPFDFTLRAFKTVLTTRQIHHVEDEQFLGSLLNGNDMLVHALMSYEQMDRSIDADSDSDDEIAEQAHLYRSKSTCDGPFAGNKLTPRNSDGKQGQRLGAHPDPAAWSQPGCPCGASASRCVVEAGAPQASQTCAQPGGGTGSRVCVGG